MKKTDRSINSKLAVLLVAMGIVLFVAGIYVGRSLGEFLHNLLN